jgi:hypothetical protein
MTQRRSGEPVNLQVIEGEVMQTLTELAGHPEHQTPLPTTMIEPTPDIGRLSADAVLAQYELAAKGVAEMGDAVKERIMALEAALKDCDADMKLLKEAADAIREKGKHAHAEIERTSAVSRDIRNVVAEIRKKIA